MKNITKLLFILMASGLVSCSGPLIHSYLPINMSPCLPKENSETEQIQTSPINKAYQDSLRTDYIDRND